MNAASPGSRTPTFSAVTIIRSVYYLGLALVLLALVTKAQTQVLPMGIAKQIGHNSESFALALAVAATIEFARPRWLRAGTREVSWGVVSLVAMGWLLLALGVYYLGLPASIKTLNEPLVAAALLTVLLGAPRPLRRAWLTPVLFLVAVVLTYHLRIVQAQAEAVTAVIAVLISTDLAARSILLPRVRDSALTWGWYLFLAVWPALMLFWNHRSPPGVLGECVNYMARGAEGFWGALLIGLYFSLLRRVETVHRPAG